MQPPPALRNARDVDDPYFDASVQREGMEHVEVQAQIMVLGYHNTGTSMLTKLLLLLGAYGGTRASMLIGEHNKLKYFERIDLINANARAMNHFGQLFRHQLIPQLPDGFEWGRMAKGELDAFDEAAKKILDDLNSHAVWAAKDPRLCYTVPLWMRHLTAPVCLVVYKHPLRVAFRLVSHPQKRAMGNYQVATFLVQWEKHLMTSLLACRGKPTVVAPAMLAGMPYHKILAGFMQRELARAGVPSLQLPSQAFLHKHFETYFDPSDLQKQARNEQVLADCTHFEAVGRTVDDDAACSVQAMLAENRQHKVVKYYQLDSQEGPSRVESAHIPVDLTPRQAALAAAMEEWIEGRFTNQLADDASTTVDWVLTRMMEHVKRARATAQAARGGGGVAGVAPESLRGLVMEQGAFG